MNIRTLAACAACAAVAGPALQADGTEPVFYTPVPYTSAADAVWDNSSFFLEDFEDGLVNTLGLTAVGGSIYSGIAVDSVDSDDGVIDGSGSGGTSWWMRATDTEGAMFTFDADALGGLPSKAGLVWTDGNPEATVTFTAYDLNMDVIGFRQFIFGDDDHFGDTDDHRFLGVEFTEGIAALHLGVSIGGAEMDHIQFGDIVGIPAPVVLALLGLAGLVGNRRRRR